MGLAHIITFIFGPDLVELRLASDAGVEHVGGDMFVSVPKGDAIFMKVSYYLKLFTRLLSPFKQFILRKFKKVKPS